MMTNSVTVQIFTGGFDPPAEHIDIPALKEKLSRIYRKARIECVMIGWAPACETGEIVDFVKQHGTDVYLWLPVFSGWDGLAPLIGSDGNPVRQDYQAEKGERFDFGCPGNPENVRKIINIFETYYASGAYDGVFLDKIRFPSFVCGTEPVLTCFCPYCRKVHGLTGNIAAHEGDNPLGITAYSGLRYSLNDERLTALFDYKAQVVSESVAALSAYFRSKNYKIGLDLFAPFLSFFVGQDYRTLAQYADFIKPMFYRKTTAPAGIPFETDMYASAFGGGAQAIESRKSRLLTILNTPAIDIDFINREITGIREITGGQEVSGIRERSGAVKLYAGVEVNYNENIAPVTGAYITENITRLKNTDGFALSWDLNTTPDDNLDAALGSM